MLNKERKKEYNKQYARYYLPQYIKRYRQTVKGKAVYMWVALNERISKVKQYKNIKCQFSKEEFYDWAIPRLEEWEQTKELSKVSLDRIDSNKDYSLDNIQLLDVQTNRIKTRNNKKYNAPKNMAWCSQCKDYLFKDLFYKNSYSSNGVTYLCKLHINLQIKTRKKV